jgi:nitrite reductase/ring-hydroxylating ferredoxin subunit
MTTDDYRTLGPSADLAEGTVNPYYLEDLKLRVAVARVAGTVYAFDDLHAECSLAAGLLDGTTIMSQCDGSKFDLGTGAVIGGPAAGPLATYVAREADGQIQVAI